jgi:hypothetical protein
MASHIVAGDEDVYREGGHRRRQEPYGNPGRRITEEMEILSMVISFGGKIYRPGAWQLENLTRWFP